jgi:hypothetical protein
MMKKSKPRAPGFIAIQELDRMQDEMLDKLKDFGPKEQKAMEDQEKKRRLAMKQEAIDAATIMFHNLDPQCHCTYEYDLICETLEELAK